MTREPNTAHHVYFQNVHPFLIGDIFKCLRAINSQVVDQNVDGWHLLKQQFNSCFRSQIGSNSLKFGIRDTLLKELESMVYALLRSAIDNDSCSFLGKCPGDR